MLIISPEQDKWLNKQSRKRKTTKSALTRQALDKLIEVSLSPVIRWQVYTRVYTVSSGAPRE